MGDVPFYATVMGHRFFEGQLPRVIDQLVGINKELERLNDSVNRLAMAVEKLKTNEPPTTL